MLNLRCPICAKKIQIEKIDDLPSFPFCSDRCKLIDLGRWMDGAYSIPGTEAAEQTGGESKDGEPPPKDGNGVAAREGFGAGD